jgi:hypothetical protein
VNPSDFESEIHKAAIEGKITNIQYYFEQLAPANVEAKIKSVERLH